MHPWERLSTALPPGRTIVSEQRNPLLWLSDAPAPAGLWSELRAGHSASGLWPLLLEGLEDHPDEGVRPWESEELFPEEAGAPADHDPAVLLAAWWRGCTALDGETDFLTAEQRAAVTAPYGLEWPGVAPAATLARDPGALADEYAASLLEKNPHLRLGLVPARSGAEALSAVGWSGPANHEEDVARLGAVLADWERRFGSRVVCLGFDTLNVSVAAPPATREAALGVAAEHFAFCPDNVWELSGERPLEAYADRLVGKDAWTFWWD